MQTGEESLKRLGLDVLDSSCMSRSTPRCQAKKGVIVGTANGPPNASTGLQRTGKIPILDAAKLQF